jgi:hypothetical protein
MNEHQTKDRWVTSESQARLTLLLGLVNDPLTQDWELVYADANRVGEFLDLYEDESLTEDDRFALMALIVASFDDLLTAGRANKAISDRFRHCLSTDFCLHKATIHYWCLLDESDANKVFRATPFMREIWSTTPCSLTITRANAISFSFKSTVD